MALISPLSLGFIGGICPPSDIYFFTDSPLVCPSPLATQVVFLFLPELSGQLHPQLKNPPPDPMKLLFWPEECLSLPSLERRTFPLVTWSHLLGPAMSVRPVFGLRCRPVPRLSSRTSQVSIFHGAAIASYRVPYFLVRVRSSLFPVVSDLPSLPVLKVLVLAGPKGFS